MSKVYVHLALANQIERRKRCESENKIGAIDASWNDADDKIGAIVKECLPSGSGCDSGCELGKLTFSRDGKLLAFEIHVSFHHMNEAGFYDGWTEHVVKVTPDWNGIDIRVSGRNRNDIKEYLGELFHSALTREVNYKTLK